MRRSSLLFVFTLAIIFAVSSVQAQQTQGQTQQSAGQSSERVYTNADLAGASSANQTGRVWTNKDMDELRAKGLISIIGTEQADAGSTLAPAQAPVGAETAPPQIAQPGPAYNSKFEDPRWYEEQAAALQEQIDGTQAALDQARANLQDARSLRATTGAIDITQGNIGVTPEEGIARLEEQVRILQEQKDELADTARRNDIAPGVVRNAG